MIVRSFDLKVRPVLLVMIAALFVCVQPRTAHGQVTGFAGEQIQSNAAQGWYNIGWTVYVYGTNYTGSTQCVMNITYYSAPGVAVGTASTLLGSTQSFAFRGNLYDIFPAITSGSYYWTGHFTPETIYDSYYYSTYALTATTCSYTTQLQVTVYGPGTAYQSESAGVIGTNLSLP